MGSRLVRPSAAAILVCLLACAPLSPRLAPSYRGYLTSLLDRVPFYAYLRLLFLLYLVLPQTQGARLLYQERIHPWLEQNESQIDDFIASAHERLRTAGIAYIKRAIELLKVKVLGMPPSPEHHTAGAAAGSGDAGSYTQSLLARFSLPAARWNSATGAAGTAGSDFYGLLASAVGAATGAAAGGSAGDASGVGKTTGTLIPDSIRGAPERMSFIAAQRERLKIVLSALDREATQLETDEEQRRLERERTRPTSLSLDGGPTEDTERPPSGQSGLSGLSKSRSEVDFEKLDAESGTEDMDNDGTLRRRTPAAATGGSWVPWGWSSGGASEGKSSSAEK